MYRVLFISLDDIDQASGYGLAGYPVENPSRDHSCSLSLAEGKKGYGEFGPVLRTDNGLCREDVETFRRSLDAVPSVRESNLKNAVSVGFSPEGGAPEMKFDLAPGERRACDAVGDLSLDGVGPAGVGEWCASYTDDGPPENEKRLERAFSRERVFRKENLEGNGCTFLRYFKTDFLVQGSSSCRISGLDPQSACSFRPEGIFEGNLALQRASLREGLT